MNLFSNFFIKNEVEQSITANVWMTESWNDVFLYWDPAEYGNIKQICLPGITVILISQVYNIASFCLVDSIWRPDTYLYNRYTGFDKSASSAENASVILLG